MSEPTPTASKASKERLLEKIKVTGQTVKRQMIQAASDLEWLYHLSDQLLLNNVEAILTSDLNELEKKEALKQLLADRWQDIKQTSYTYCQKPRDPLNQLCLALALYISPLPENLSDCDNWEVGEGPYFILMPDLEACNDIVGGTNIHQYRLHEFILSEDSKRYIPIYETLNYFYESSSKKPFHMVFTTEQMNDNTLDKKENPLTDIEIEQLSNHSEITIKLMRSLAILKDPNASFYNRLDALADGLFAGSSHGGSGQDLNAAAQANEAIVAFFSYWDGLPQAMRDYYFSKVPLLKPILGRLSDPVAIAEQGVNYCVGLTAGDLRTEVKRHRGDLQSGDVTKLQEAVQQALKELEAAIKQPGYTLNPVKKNSIPYARRIMDIPVDEQHRLIRDYLHLDYPNFLLYAFEQQPEIIKSFKEAFQGSKYKNDMLRQRAHNGLSALMLAAQSYPEALEPLLESCLELSNDQLKDELMIITQSGDSLPFIILQQRPQALPQLLAAIHKLTTDSQLQLLTQLNANHATIVMMAMESSVDAFTQLCELIGTFTADDIAKILQLANHEGDTLLMMALRNYPHAVAPLMTLFDKCKANDQKILVTHTNNAGFNLPFFALIAEANHFQTILDVATRMTASQFKAALSSFNPDGESFFLRASCSQAENFNAALALLDKFLIDEQLAFFKQHDSHGNHLLLLTMLHQQIPPTILLNKLKSLPQAELYTLLTTRNQDGFTPLTLALTQQPQYFSSIVELVSCLSDDQQDAIWQQVGVNGWHLPFIASIYAPEHLPSVMSHVNDSTLLAGLNQTDLSGNGLLALTASFQPEHLPGLIATIKAMSIDQRFRLLSHCNQQGDNLLSWILQQDVSLLGDFFKLMAGFTIEQQVSLISHRNRQGRHALTIAYIQDEGLLDNLFNFLDNLNVGKKEAILAELPASHWFDLLSLACVNQSTFRTLYDNYQTIHKGNKTALSNLLTCVDASNNNLLMLIIQNNPSLVGFMVREVKTLPDEKAQRRIMVQTNAHRANVLSLAEKYTPDNIVASLQSFLKSLDKQSTQRMMLETTMKMHSANVLISSEMLEDCDAEGLFKKLSETDAQGHNLLGQIIIRMPHRLPALIEKMQHLLSSEQMRLLLAHHNEQGASLYWLALEQPQAAYLCHQLQAVINRYDNEAQMTMLTPPAEQSMIESALKHGKAPFDITMQWVDKFKEVQRDEIIRQFWQRPSEQLKRAVERHDVDVCQRLISSTRRMMVDDVVALMLQNRQALILALTSDYIPIKGLMCQWLLTLPKNKQFEVLSTFSAEAILSLLDNEQMSLVDALPLHQQAQLLSLQDRNGHNVLITAFTKNHRCRDKLIRRLPLFTLQQQATLFQANEERSFLLHTLAKTNKPLFKQCLAKVRMLSSQTQFTLLSQVDNQRFTPLDHLLESPELYEEVLSLFASLSLTDQIQLFAQKTGPHDMNLLMNAPLQFKERIFKQFMRFPQSAQIEILLSMSDNNKDSLKTLMQTSPWLQSQLLDIIQTFPKHIQGSLCSAKGGSDDSLISWMVSSGYDDLKKRAITLMVGMARADVSALLKQKNPENGDNLLQTLAKESPSLFRKVFSIFVTLPAEDKVEILSQQNNNHMSLFGDLVNNKLFDQFEKLCEIIAQFQDDEKIRILSASGFVPIETTTLWVSLLYGAPQSKNFIKLINNKAFFKPMFHLLQTLPPKALITILTNRSGVGKTIIEEILEPEQSKLRLVLQQAQAFAEAKELLDKMAAMIPNEQVHDPESHLHQLLVHRLESYQTTYYKGIKHIHELSNGWAHDIEAAWPKIENKLTFSNIIIGLLKLAASLLMPAYGGYKLYEKVTTNRNTIFQTERESIIYRLEDLATKIEQTEKVLRS